MKRTIILLLILTLLGGITWYTLQNKPKDAMPVSTSSYAIDDISKIYLTGITYPNGRKDILKREEGGWTYNGEKANQNVVNNMLNTVKRLRILYATPESARLTMLKSLATNKVKVEFYDQDHNPLQIFYVGEPSTDGNSTYFIKEGSNEPDLVGIPGFTGSIGGYFKKPASDWKNLIIFNLSPDKIKSISLEYPSFKNKSFKLTHDDNKFSVTPFYPINLPTTKPYKKGCFKTYLSFFEKIQAEALEPNIKLRDSLNKRTPFATITLNQTGNEVHTIQFHPYVPEGSTLETLPDQHRDKYSLLGVNRYFVINEDNECFLTQQRVIGKVLWTYQDFFN